ncbi:hypothetical protein ECNE098_4828, partial [Escherichia coli NE098]
AFNSSGVFSSVINRARSSLHAAISVLSVA